MDENEVSQWLMPAIALFLTSDWQSLSNGTCKADLTL